MSEYWKSTPRYWCKFCEVFVRDTGIERRNHEASGKHQGAIQRSLRQVHKIKQNQERDQQRAKNELNRLNNLVGTDAVVKKTADPVRAPAQRINVPRVPGPAPAVGDAASQRRAVAEQWSAMGIALPKELQEEATGTGAWQTVSERVVRTKQSPETTDDTTPAPLIRGVHKRKMEDDGEDDNINGEHLQHNARKAWGSKFKSYGDSNATTSQDADEDLNILLSGVGKSTDVKSESAATTMTTANASEDMVSQAVKVEHTPTTADDLDVKQEDDGSAVTAPPVVTFKKRKWKR